MGLTLIVDERAAIVKEAAAVTGSVASANGIGEGELEIAKEHLTCERAMHILNSTSAIKCLKRKQ